MCIRDSTYTVLTKNVIAAIGDNICIPVPQTVTADLLTIVNGVWPKSPTKMTIDNACECPLCDGVGCDLDTCHCINETTYNLTLESVAPTRYNLC